MRSIQAAIVDTVGGTVEGKPTHEGNYLQRLRGLVQSETQLSLAQTEIKGHMRIEDDLKRDLGLERESHEVTKRMLSDRDDRIAELEKDAARLEAILAIWKAHRADQDAEDPDETDSYDRVCYLLDEALKSRA